MEERNKKKRLAISRASETCNQDKCRGREDRVNARVIRYDNSGHRFRCAFSADPLYGRRVSKRFRLRTKSERRRCCHKTLTRRPVSDTKTQGKFLYRKLNDHCVIDERQLIRVCLSASYGTDGTSSLNLFPATKFQRRSILSDLWKRFGKMCFFRCLQVTNKLKNMHFQTKMWLFRNFKKIEFSLFAKNSDKFYIFSTRNDYFLQLH